VGIYAGFQRVMALALMFFICSILGMRRHKGELTPAAIDRGWPHQVALRAEITQASFREIEMFCADLSKCPREPAVFHDGGWWNVYCFAETDHAARFMTRWGGEPFNPADRGKGSNWAQWRK
jgi:hypothetical protein